MHFYEFAFLQNYLTFPACFSDMLDNYFLLHVILYLKFFLFFHLFNFCHSKITQIPYCTHIFLFISSFINEVFLVFLLLTLNIFHNFFLPFLLLTLNKQMLPGMLFFERSLIVQMKIDVCSALKFTNSHNFPNRCQTVSKSIKLSQSCL